MLLSLLRGLKVGEPPFKKDFEEAEFNLAAGTVMRINGELNKINIYLQQTDYINAFKSLQTIFSEISPFLMKDSQKKYDEEKEEETEIEKMMAGCCLSQKDGKMLFSASPELDNRLREWDRKLRFHMLKYKLYMKMQDTRLAAEKI